MNPVRAIMIVRGVLLLGMAPLWIPGFVLWAAVEGALLYAETKIELRRMERARVGTKAKPPNRTTR